MTYLMGIDVSTTAAKTLLVDEKGQVIASATSDYPLSTPKPLWSEQNPHDWWQGVQSSIRQALEQAGLQGSDVAGIGLTGQMHGLVMLDRSGNVLRPAILWNDQRTGVQCNEIRLRVGRKRLIEITGNECLTGFTAPKILWVQQNEPEIFTRAAQILLPKDYIRYRLSGAYATDRAGAAGTQLLDIRSRNWSEEMLQALEIPFEWLPPTHEGPQITGEVSQEAAQITGLTAGTPIVGGGGDQAAQAVGVGAIEEGIVALTLGTSGVVFASTRQPAIEPEGRLHAFCHAVPGTWHMMGVMLSAAGSLRWYRDTLAPGQDFDSLLAPAKEIEPGAEGLLFLPYLSGERTPHPDPMARGAFVGLTLRHGRDHMTRAVLEGVAFGLRDSFTLIESAGLAQARQVRVSGGGARSPLWRQILADVLDAELVTVNTSEGAAFGAALLAGVGAGVWGTVAEACHTAIHVTGSTQPDPQNVARYEEEYPKYRALYPALKEIFSR